MTHAHRTDGFFTGLFMKYISFIYIILFLIPIAGMTKEPDQFVIENISIEGNGKTKDYVVLENLSFGVGDSVTEADIQRGIDGLRGLHIFKDVILHPRPGSAPGRLNLTIQIEERKWPALLFKGGFNELNGWYLTPLSLNLDNIFGYGNFMSLNLTFGDRITRLNFDYINPDILDTGLDYYFTINLKNYQYINYIEDKQYKQQVPQAGYFMGLKSRSGLFSHFLFGWDIYTTRPDSFFTGKDSKDKFYDIPDQLSQYSLDGIVTSAFSVYFDLDTRDQYYYPTGGWWMGLRLARAENRLGSDTDFSKAVFDLRKYFGLYQHVVIAGRLRVGSVSASAPFFEKFYLGGPNSLRGFDDRSLSPQGGGDRLYQAGAELRFPIATKNFPRHFLTGVLFYDTGAALPADKVPEYSDLHSSAGFGFRFKLPFISLLRLDIAYPLNTDADESRIQLSIGHTF